MIVIDKARAPLNSGSALFSVLGSLLAHGCLYDINANIIADKPSSNTCSKLSEITMCTPKCACCA
jgi:hypothetical protein